MCAFSLIISYFGVVHTVVKRGQAISCTRMCVSCTLDCPGSRAVPVRHSGLFAAEFLRAQHKSDLIVRLGCSPRMPCHGSQMLGRVSKRAMLQSRQLYLPLPSVSSLRPAANLGRGLSTEAPRKGLNKRAYGKGGADHLTEEDSILEEEKHHARELRRLWQQRRVREAAAYFDKMKKYRQHHAHTQACDRARETSTHRRTPRIRARMHAPASFLHKQEPPHRKQEKPHPLEPNDRRIR